MSNKQHIDAVFDNEDDAQSASIQAKLLGASQCQVERFFNDDDGDATVAPFLGTTSGSGSGNTGLNSAGINPSFGFVGINFMNDNGSDRTPKALFSCEIDADKEAECRDLLRAHGGRVY